MNLSKENISILLVEDDEVYSGLLYNKLKRHFQVTPAFSVEDAQEHLNKGVFHGILLDVRLEQGDDRNKDGLQLLRDIKEDRPLMPVIVMTAFGDIHTSVEAMKLGANDFIEKGEVKTSELAAILKNHLQQARNQLKLNARSEEFDLKESVDLVGSSPTLEVVTKNINIAANDGHCSVLVLGETGTGKELIARRIYEQGWRREGPFVAVAISGLSPTIVESELFGHEKGAFTDAKDSRTGYIEQANGGVLFLDEIGELSSDLQIKLLRFLEDRIMYRVGSSKGRPMDVQLISATNQNLRKMVKDGGFREDLYYRIRTVEVTAPPLRDRKEDIPLLADHFLQQLRNQGRTKLAGFSPQAIDKMKSYGYPGNVRELKAIVEWSVLVAGGAEHWVVEDVDLPAEIKEDHTYLKDGYQVNLGNNLNVERACALAELLCVEKALKSTRGQKQKAEPILGYGSRHTMRRRIQRIKDKFPEIWEEFPYLTKAYADEWDTE